MAGLLPVGDARLEEEAERAAEATAPGEDVRGELELLRQEVDQSWQSEEAVVEPVSEQRHQVAPHVHDRRWIYASGR